MSHLRFGEDPIDAPDSVACHNPAYLQKFDAVGQLKNGGVSVVNIADGTNFDEAFPAAMRKRLAELDAKVYTIDATAPAIKLGIPGRINMIMQTVFFSRSGVLPADKTIPLLEKSGDGPREGQGREGPQLPDPDLPARLHGRRRLQVCLRRGCAFDGPYREGCCD